MRTILAGITFTILYGIAVRLYVYRRVRRDADRWHVPAVMKSGLLGGLAFYLSSQIKSPYVPRLLDIPAFLILAIAATAIPVIIELKVVLQARRLKKATLQSPPIAPSEREGRTQ
jgi:hypothetical protein